MKTIFNPIMEEEDLVREERMRIHPVIKNQPPVSKSWIVAFRNRARNGFLEERPAKPRKEVILK